MAYLRDTAIVLKAEPFREQDVWLTMFGKRYGKMTAVARGSRRLTAKHLGHVEPLTAVEVMLARGAAFDKLAVARLEQPRLHLRSSLAGLAFSGAFADLVHRLTRQEAPDPELYNLLLEVLDALQGIMGTPSVERVQFLLSGATLKLFDLLGYGLELERCPTCRDPLQEQIFLLAGNLSCSRCVSNKRQSIEAPTLLPERTVSLLRFLRAQPLVQALSITAPRTLFIAIDRVITSAFQHTPINAEPHGAKTVAALLA